MMLMKVILFLVPLSFFFVSDEYASGAPAATAGLALVLWLMERDEPPVLSAWGATLVGVAMAIYKGTSILAVAAGLPLLALALVTVLQTRRADASVSPGMLSGMLALVAVSGFMGLRGSSTQVPIGAATRIVVFGDSLAAGVPGDNVQRLWPMILGERLGAEVVNLSYPGDTIAQAQSRWAANINDCRFHPTIPGWRPDLVVVELGGNNILQKHGPDQLDRQLRAFVQALESCNTRVLIIAVPGAAIGDSYKGTWRRIAADYDFVEYMSQDALRTILTNPQYTLVDNIHFNQAGHEYFAERVARRIEGE